MKIMAAIFFTGAFLVGSAVHAASMADAREIARINNCPPKKIEVYQQSLGADGQTIYRVDCNLPKATGETEAGADSLLITCSDNLCTMLRPMMADKK